MSRKLVLSTGNQDKIVEIKNLLQHLEIEILTLDAFPGAPDVVEDGETLEENAIKKARAIADFTGLPAVADDTGLEVNYLDGAPGVYSSRYSGEHATYADNVNKLLRELMGVPREKRGARFRYVAAFCNQNDCRTIEGKCEGVIGEERRGTGGFGYDPVFYVQEHGRTFAEMDLELKNRISHRAKAFLKLRELIERGEFDFRAKKINFGA